MKKVFILILTIITVTIFVPYLLVLNFSNYKNEKTIKIPQKISVYIKNEDRVCDMDFSQYLKEVVSAEMPAEFHEEALRAQAIAARTYVINRVNAYKNSKTPEEHKGAYICTDSAHCKAWVSEERRKSLWPGEKADEYWKKISKAVDSTGNLIITYNDEPISAVFHSTSSGFTENASDVWGGDVKYLVSVKSEGDENSPKFKSEKIMSIDEFKKIAEEKIPGVLWDKGIIGNISRTNAGGITKIEVGGVSIKGTDFRFMYDLRSTNIQFELTQAEIKMSVKGYGHGVGMSQYGANYLAQNGKNYEDILKTYYTGVNISEKKIENE